MVFISSFILTFLFFLGIMGIIWLIDWIKYKKVNITFLSSIAGMTAFYLIKNYMLIYSMFVDSEFVSHRDEMDLGYKDLNGTWELFLKNFTERHTHVLDLHHKIIFPVVIVALLIGIFKKVNIKPILGLLILNVLFSTIYALWYWEGTRFLKYNIILFDSFNFFRFNFLISFFLYIYCLLRQKR